MKKYDIFYAYKEGSLYWLVWGSNKDFMGPQEMCFKLKRELNSFASELLGEPVKMKCPKPKMYGARIKF